MLQSLESLRVGHDLVTKQPTPVFLPGEFLGQRSLVGYTPRGSKESDRTEHACMRSTTRIPMFKNGRMEVRVAPKDLFTKCFCSLKLWTLLG